MAGFRDRGEAASERRSSARSWACWPAWSVLARNTLNFACQPDENLGPPDRLATADTRLDAMLEAIKWVRRRWMIFLQH